MVRERNCTLIKRRLVGCSLPWPRLHLHLHLRLGLDVDWSRRGCSLALRVALNTISRGAPSSAEISWSLRRRLGDPEAEIHVWSTLSLFALCNCTDGEAVRKQTYNSRSSTEKMISSQLQKLQERPRHYLLISSEETDKEIATYSRTRWAGVFHFVMSHHHYWSERESLIRFCLASLYSYVPITGGPPVLFLRVMLHLLHQAYGWWHCMHA
jgi:hypothetical protein